MDDQIRGDSSTPTVFTLAVGSVENGSFETGDFQGWNTIGDTSIETEDLGIFLPDGTHQALITNGDSDAGGSVVDTDLEEFLDLASGAFDDLVASDAFEGSAIKQNLSLEAGDVVSFDWNFLTNENTPDDTFNDTAFLNFGGFTFELADTGANFVDASRVDEFEEQTDTQTLTFRVNTAGTYTIGFGVIDVGDAIVNSALAIDDVAIQAASNFNVTGEGDSSSSSSSQDVDLTFGEGGFMTFNDSSMAEAVSGFVFNSNGELEFI
ncbi:MAG: hypothetical protein AAF383_26565 [Cyanobacteria bacterium P01_A01_bin.83]